MHTLCTARELENIPCCHQPGFKSEMYWNVSASSINITCLKYLFLFLIHKLNLICPKCRSFYLKRTCLSDC